MTFLSTGLRMLVNVEALNMVESVGNVVRHRTVPMLIRKTAGQYIMRWVPAISGECLAHAYQTFLAELAQRKGLNVCYWCAKNEFIKHFDFKFYELTSKAIDKEKGIEYSQEENELVKYLKEKNLLSQKGNLTLEDVKKIEEAVVKSCVVEDIGGFLTTEGPTKRTARFYVSYAIPTYDTVKDGIIALDHQFMVRYAPEAELRRQGKQEIPPAQAPYYPQVGSALYAWIFNIDLNGIGVSGVTGKPILEDEEIKKRRELSLDALAEMLDNKLFGAKLTRFTPFIDYEVILATTSKGLKFTISTPTLSLKDFVKETVKRAERAKQDIKESEINVIVWCKDDDIKRIVEEIAKDKVILLVERSVRDLISEIKKYVL